MEVDGAFEGKKVAIVHDWLTNMGGAENCVINFNRILPQAPIYTLLFKPGAMSTEFGSMDIRTSFLQRITGGRFSHQPFFPLMPLAFESFDMNDYDLVLSSSSACSKGVITKSGTVHVCYCYTPIRYVWEYWKDYAGSSGFFKRLFLGILLHYMRLWDYSASGRVDHFVAISRVVQERIRKFYRRESVVIHPPVRCRTFTISDNDGDFYLVVSRLVGYKRFDLAVQACTELGRRLIVIGEGPELGNLKDIAGPTVEFLGRQPDDVVKKHMSECRALLFPGEEDFGIVPVEAQACGRPVIAFGMGGALDTIVDGVTGVFFHEQVVPAVCDAIRQFEGTVFDKEQIRQHALQFDEAVFREKITSFLLSVMPPPPGQFRSEASHAGG